MPTLTIEGRKVKVGDDFLKLSPQDQDATVQEIARELGIGQTGGESAQPEEGGSTWGGALQQFGESFNRGLYGAANLPTTLANMATGVLGIDYQFKRPLEAAAPSLDRTIMEVPEPQGPGEKMAGYVGDFMGANALPAAGMLKAAPAIANATANATGLAGQSVNRMASGIAAAPGTAAAGEVLASIGGGVGASMAEGSGPMAEYLASLAGSVAAPMTLAVSPTRLAAKAGKAAWGKFSPEAVARQQRQQIAAGLRDQITPAGRQSIDDTMAIQGDVPGYRPSLAEATENPSLIATQRAYEGELSGPELDAAMRRYGDNEAAIGAATRDLAPTSPLDLDQAFRTGQRRIDRAVGRLDNQAARVDREMGTLAGNLAAGRRDRDLGGTIREDLIGRRQGVKQEMSATAQGMGLNNPAARFPFAQAKERLARAVTPRSPMADRSALPNQILADIQNAPDNVSIVDLMELRTRITTDIREASRTPTGEKRVPYLEALKSELDAATDDMIRSIGDPGLADNLTRFRRMYLTDYVQPFEQGAAARVLKTDTTGGYAVPDEKVAREFFNGWTQTAADQFRRVFPDSAAASAAMESAALDDLFSAAVRGGQLEPSLVDAWTRRNAAVLDSFPNIRANVQNTEQALARLTARRATIATRKKQVESSVLARELARVDNATTTPEQIVSQAIRNPARMNRILGGVKTKAARDAIAREAWKQALESGDPARFIADNRNGLSRALGPRYQTAERLARAIQKNRLVSRPAGQPIDTNPVASVENLLGSGLNQISSRVFAVKSGRTSARYALTDIAGRAFRNMTARQARQTLQDALYDPQIATDLATMLETGGQLTGAPQMKRLYTFLVSNGIAADTREDAREFGPR